MTGFITEHERAEAARLGKLLIDGTISETDAGMLVYMLLPLAGWYDLVSIGAEDVREAAIERWGEFDGLDIYVTLACRKVSGQWASGNSDDANIFDEARDWALELIGEMAEADGKISGVEAKAAVGGVG